MFRTSPPRFALACLALWLVQWALSLLLAGHFWGLSSLTVKWLAAAQLMSQTLLGLLILVQIPRALQWRPRRNPRPSPEVQTERQRIARELHDNVGSQLVTTMGLLDPQLPAHSQALRALEQCLLDLRLVVDSMDSSADMLADRLARLRHRMQPVLDRRGIRMAWQVQTAEGIATPCGARAQHMVSIVQEALSNVLQHAQATQVAVRLHYAGEPGAWCLEVCDNGRGLPEASTAAGAQPPGFGLEGMRSRALQMGGTLELVRPEEGGTCIRLVLPVDGAPGPLRQGLHGT